MKFTGDGTWVYEAIQEHSFICVSDGSYNPQMDPTLCSTPIILECTTGCGHLTVSFAERSNAANAFSGELLGLLAIHLLLHSMDISQPHLEGSLKLYSDCKGALTTIGSLPLACIPSSLRHADILKIMAVHCHTFHFDLS